MKAALRNTLFLSIFVMISTPALAGDAAAGKNKAMLCGGCHGMNGISMSPEIPNLAGQKEAYLVKAIKDYKSGMRKNPMMSSVVASVAEADIADIAAYFASLKP